MEGSVGVGAVGDVDIRGGSDDCGSSGDHLSPSYPSTVPSLDPIASTLE